MRPLTMDQGEISYLTEAYGGQWGIQHTRRLLSLVNLIADGRSYDQEVVWTAAHLHDWGAYSNWAQVGVDHAVRSKAVAEEFLKDKECPDSFITHVLECIEYHHQNGPGRSIEAQLLHDADVLDFLGVVGIARDFSKNSRDLRKAFETIQKRRSKLPATLYLEKSRQMAVERLESMDAALAAFEKETFGNF